MPDTTGEQDLRTQQWDRDVKGFALQNYKFKQLVMVVSTNAWTNSYYKETAADLTESGTGVSFKGIPRLANFPYAEVSWTLASSVVEKYGCEGVISWEDANTNNIDVLSRTLLRIGRAIAKKVDAQIWAGLSENYPTAATTINTLDISVGSEWNSATIANRDPVQNILDARREIAIDGYDVNSDNLYLCVNESDYASLLGNSKVVNNPSFKSADVVTNGVVGQLCGAKLMVSNNVSVSGALLVIAKECGTWKEAMPLRTETITDPMIKYTIRAAEMGVLQLTNPQAVCLIRNTRA